MRVILVPVADRPECAKALKTACDLGQRIGASISGCHIRPHRYSDVSLSSEFANAAWRRKNNKKTPQAAQAMYRGIAEENGYELIRRARTAPGALWSEKVGSPDRIMGIVGPVADLIVVSRPEKPGSIADVFVQAALLQSSRPVLILPQAGRRNVGTRVCIGWNQSPQAARAVAAAIPILQQAEEVTIVSAGTEDRPGPKSTQIAAYLAHWGIKTKRVSTRGRDINADLLSTCKDIKADLLVAGAYSRSRWREKVFGGTTEFLVRKARLPVFILHG